MVSLPEDTIVAKTKRFGEKKKKQQKQAGTRQATHWQQLSSGVSLASKEVTHTVAATGAALHSADTIQKTDYSTDQHLQRQRGVGQKGRS